MDIEANFQAQYCNNTGEVLMGESNIGAESTN